MLPVIEPNGVYKYTSTPSAQDMLGVNRRTLQMYVAENLVECRRVKSEVWFLGSHLLKFLEGQDAPQNVRPMSASTKSEKRILELKQRMVR